MKKFLKTYGSTFVLTMLIFILTSCSIDEPIQSPCTDTLAQGTYISTLDPDSYLRVKGNEITLVSDNGQEQWLFVYVSIDCGISLEDEYGINYFTILATDGSIVFIDGIQYIKN